MSLYVYCIGLDDKYEQAYSSCFRSMSDGSQMVVIKYTKFNESALKNKFTMGLMFASRVYSRLAIHVQQNKQTDKQKDKLTDRSKVNLVS